MTAALRKRLQLIGIATVLFLASMSHSYGQTNLVNIQQLDSLLEVNPKPVLILLSTNWCQYCQMQKQQVRKNKEFKTKDSLFHYVEFDAESKESVVYNGKQYHYKSRGANIGTHELSTALNGSNKLAYPTWVLLDEKYQTQFRHQGVLIPKQLNELLEALEDYQQ